VFHRPNPELVHFNSEENMQMLRHIGNRLKPVKTCMSKHALEILGFDFFIHPGMQRIDFFL
jgi:hypothetical protein